ncbi:MAG: hypothetical protein ABIK78_07340, partial [candidate division WOR-3 bacterium]
NKHFFALLNILFRMQTTLIGRTDLIWVTTGFIPLLVLWASPIIIGLRELNTIYVNRTRRILIWILQNLKDHTVIFGYGDLGKKVCQGIFSQIVEPSLKEKNEKFKWAEVLSTRGFKFVRISTDFVVVDKNPAVFDETHPDPDYGTLGICDIEIPGENEKVALLGIVGDCKEGGIQDNVNMIDSKIIILVARDEEAVFPIFNEIYKLHLQSLEKVPSAIIRVERGIYAPYLEWRCVDKNIYFVYTPFLRGTTIGEMISADLIKQVGNKEEISRKKILILGRGNQIFYIIRSVHTHLTKFFFSNSYLSDRFIQENIIIVSDEEYFRKISTKIKKQIKTLDERYTFIIEGILSKRNIFPFLYAWKIPYYHNLPRDARIVEQIIGIEKPSVIAVVANNFFENVNIIQEVVHALEKLNYDRKEIKPHIIVGSGIIEWYRVGDALAWWRSFLKDYQFYPVQEFDTVVDFYDDAANMVINLYKSLIEEVNEKTPIEISRCATRVPYGLAEFTSIISNLKFEFDKNIKNNLKQIPIFHNYKTQSINSAKFKNLKKEKETKGFCFEGIITAVKFQEDLYQKVNKRHHIIVIGARRDRIEPIKKILKHNFVNPKEGLPKRKDIECPGVRLCPIDISQRHIRTLEEMEKMGGRTESISKKKRSFCSHCLHNEIKDNNIKDFEIDYKTCAQIAICGYGGEEYGALARAINLLLFRNKVEKRCNNNVINLNYERSFSCVHSLRNYYKFYGYLDKWNEKRLEEIETQTYINAILIRATSKDSYNIWLEYMKNFFDNIIKDKYPYRLFFSRSRGIILLFRNDEFLKNLLEENKEQIEEELSNNEEIPNWEEPDLFLYTLRGYKYQLKRLGKEILCTERETSCPFEKIQDESRNYDMRWQEYY